jgi:hypothetical protein
MTVWGRGYEPCASLEHHGNTLSQGMGTGRNACVCAHQQAHTGTYAEAHALDWTPPLAPLIVDDACTGFPVFCPVSEPVKSLGQSFRV